jgi:hypothetical protein
VYETERGEEMSRKIMYWLLLIACPTMASTNEIVSITNYFNLSLYASNVCSFVLSPDAYIQEGVWTNLIKVVGTNGVTRTYKIKQGKLVELKGGKR